MRAGKTPAFEAGLVAVLVFVARLVPAISNGALQGMDSWLLLADASRFWNHQINIQGNEIYNAAWPGSLVLAGMLHDLFPKATLAIPSIVEALSSIVFYALALALTGDRRLSALAAFIAYMYPGSAIFGVQVTKEGLAKLVVYGVLTLLVLGRARGALLLSISLIPLHHLTSIAWGTALAVAGAATIIAGRPGSQRYTGAVASGVALVAGEALWLVARGYTSYVRVSDWGVAISLYVVVLLSAVAIAVLAPRQGSTLGALVSAVTVLMAAAGGILLYAGLLDIASRITLLLSLFTLAILMYAAVREICWRDKCLLMRSASFALLVLALAASLSYPAIGPSTTARIASMGVAALSCTLIVLSRSSARRFTVPLLFVVAASSLLVVPLLASSQSPLTSNIVYTRGEVLPLAEASRLGLDTVAADVPGGAVAEYYGLRWINLCSGNTHNIVYASADNFAFGCRSYAFDFPLGSNAYRIMAEAGVVYSSGEAFLLYGGDRLFEGVD